MPKIESREAYESDGGLRDVTSSSHARDRLNAALSGRKPFRAFEEAYCTISPEDLEQWFKFEREAHRQQVLQWLQLNDMTLDDTTEA